jgi:hypothetical protein
MDRPDIARSKVDTLSVRWSVVLEQLNPVPGRLENGDRDLGTGDSGDFTGEITPMMRPMRKLETEDVSPKGERPVDVRNRETGVIRGDNAKWRRAHAYNRWNQIFSSRTFNAQRLTSNAQLRGKKCELSGGHPESR